MIFHKDIRKKDWLDLDNSASKVLKSMIDEEDDFELDDYKIEKEKVIEEDITEDDIIYDYYIDIHRELLD